MLLAATSIAFGVMSGFVVILEAVCFCEPNSVAGRLLECDKKGYKRVKLVVGRGGIHAKITSRV
jgi:hypothetical protein